jgi:hypothetical protein
MVAMSAWTNGDQLAKQAIKRRRRSTQKKSAGSVQDPARAGTAWLAVLPCDDAVD